MALWLRNPMLEDKRKNAVSRITNAVVCHVFVSKCINDRKVKKISLQLLPMLTKTHNCLVSSSATLFGLNGCVCACECMECVVNK